MGIYHGDADCERLSDAFSPLKSVRVIWSWAALNIAVFLLRSW